MDVNSKSQIANSKQITIYKLEKFFNYKLEFGTCNL